MPCLRDFRTNQKLRLEDELSDIFEEVDEEIRKDKFSQLWKKYGSWLIACVAVILVSAVGFVQWQNYNHEMRAQSSAKFMKPQR